MSISSLKKTLPGSAQETEYIPMSEGVAHLDDSINSLREVSLPVTSPSLGFTDNDACRIAIN